MSSLASRACSQLRALTSAVAIGALAALAPAQSAFTSDDFNRCGEIGGPWTAVDPYDSGDFALVAAGTQEAGLLISIDEGAGADAWLDLRSPRLRQPVSLDNFVLEASILTPPSERYQLAGIVAEHAPGYWLRFDFYHDGNNLWCFAATTANGQSSMVGRTAVPESDKLFMRIERVGALWIHSFSTDGVNWELNTEFVSNIVPDWIGPFAGNAGPSPAYVAHFDYVVQQGDLAGEDQGTPTGDPRTLSRSLIGPGTGTLLATPDLASYPCGSVVTLEVVPDAGNQFNGWFGDLSGYENPVQVVLSEDMVVEGRIDPIGPPAIFDLAVQPGASAATVTWTTNEPATSQVAYGLDSSLGQVVDSSLLVTDHELLLTGLMPGETYYFQVTSADSGGESSTSELTTFDTNASIGPIADDFNRCGGLGDLWTAVDPVGGSTISLSGVGSGQATLNIKLPAGEDRDPWKINRSTRVMQLTDDEDLEIEAAFLSSVEDRYEIQGILVEQDESNWLRFDFYTNGSQTFIFSAVTRGQASVAKYSSTVPSDVPLKMRVRRDGDDWSQEWALVGSTTWNQAASYTEPLVVNRTGLMAGTAGVNPPAFEMEVDYFWRTSDAILAEDQGLPVGGPYQLTSANQGSGGGTVAILPLKSEYECGDVVTITATPDGTSSFQGWVGALEGSPNPVTLTVDNDLTIEAFFESTLPPVISDLQIDTTTSTALLTWLTNKPATTRLDYGLTPSLGDVVLDPALKLSHAILLEGLPAGTTHSYVVSATDSSSQTTSTDLATFATAVSVGPFSDDFNRCEGLSSNWTLVDPFGGATVELTDTATSEASMTITVPAGFPRDAWNGNSAPRIVQPADDEDLELEVSFLSTVSLRYQLQGIIIEESPEHWLRFDFYSSGGNTNIFAAKTVNNSSSALSKKSVPSGVPLKMRITRIGDEWMQFWSADDGLTWELATSFEYALEVSQVALFGGSAGFNAPGHTMVVDYFLDSRDAPAVEDGPIDEGPYTISTPGDGTVTVVPDQPTYSCGDVVEITAIPPAGLFFSGWEGYLEGQGSTVSLMMGESFAATPIFIPPPPPVISDLQAAVGAHNMRLSWVTDVPADTRIEYGTSPAYGELLLDPTTTLLHNELIGFLEPGSTYYVRVSASADGGTTFSSQELLLDTLPAEASLSADFNASNLELERWSFQDPLADSTYRLEGAGSGDAGLVIALPEGVAHDGWSNGNETARFVQVVEDTDLDVAVRIDSSFTSQYQVQGLMFLVEEDASEEESFIRVDYYHTGAKLYVFAATVDKGVPNARVNKTISTGPWTGAPLFLRVAREGNDWHVLTSFDAPLDALKAEETWTWRGSFEHEVVVSAVGMHAGNAGSNPPAFNARFDWFFDSYDPIQGEDQSVEPDMLPPHVYRDSITLLGSDSARVRWWTDELGTGTFRYGLTTDLEAGSVAAEILDHGQAILVDGLMPDQTYYYAIETSDGLNTGTSSVSTFSTPRVGWDGPGPIIDLWYAEQQPSGRYSRSFGQNGLAQPICNILGNATDSLGFVSSISYSLNGGPDIPLTLGPDSRRLLRPGDFNIDMAVEDMLPGMNEVILTAFDDEQNETRVAIDVDLDPDTVSTISGTIDWSLINDPNEVGQVIDGKWEIDGGILRAPEIGYDRFLGLSDYRWKDFEIEVPVTIRSVDAGGFTFPSNEPLVGFALRWIGHSETTQQPDWQFWPMGGYCGFEWSNPRNGVGDLFVRPNEDDFKQEAAFTWQLNVTYRMKARVTTDAAGISTFLLKVWDESQIEPDWMVGVVLDEDIGLPDPEAGSVGILSHHVDAEFGAVTIQRLDTH